VQASVQRSLNGRAEEFSADGNLGLTDHTRLFAYGARSDLEFPSGLARIDARTEALGAGAELLMHRGKAFDDRLTAGIGRKDSTAAVGPLPLLDERVTVGQLSYLSRWGRPERAGRIRASLLASIPAATEFNVDRRTRSGLPTASDRFGSASVRYTEAFRLAPSYEALVSVGGQYAWAPLPYALKFAYGGAGYGGAFRPDSLVGDNGASAALEMRRWFKAAGPLDEGRAYLRLDAGWAKSRNAPFAPLEDRAASIGLGLKAKVGRRLSIQVEYNTPLLRPRFAAEPWSGLLIEILAQLQS
jgi:hemolysin activation/secretion protein